MDNDGREASQPAGSESDEAPELTLRERLAIRFFNWPLISLLILDPRFGWVCLVLALMLLGMAPESAQAVADVSGRASARGARERSGHDPGLVAETERRQTGGRLASDEAFGPPQRPLRKAAMRSAAVWMRSRAVAKQQRR